MECNPDCFVECKVRFYYSTGDIFTVCVYMVNGGPKICCRTLYFLAEASCIEELLKRSICWIVCTVIHIKIAKNHCFI